MKEPARYRFVGRFRPDLRDQECRIINTWRRKGKHNVRIEFDDGLQLVTPMRCLRRVKP